jgi:hypothetical protein
VWGFIRLWAIIPVLLAFAIVILFYGRTDAIAIGGLLLVMIAEGFNIHESSMRYRRRNGRNGS